MKLVKFELDTLTLDPENARLHSDRNIEVIAQSLEKFGQQKPIVVDGENVVVAGNGTVLAARKLGWQAVYGVRSDLNGMDRRAYAIADNRATDTSQWDFAQLIRQLDEIEQEMGDTAFTGFSDFDVADLRAMLDGAPDPDALQAKHGKPQEEETWPVLKIQISPETMELHRSLMDQAPGKNEAEKYAWMLSCVDRAAMAEINGTPLEQVQ